MSEVLDFSTGKEPRLSVDVSGWSNDQKRSFADAMDEIVGIVSVQSAGGNTSFYVYFRPEEISEEALRLRLTELAHSTGGLGGQIRQNVLTADGATVTVDGKEVTFSVPEPAVSEPVRSSAWTGIASVQERVVAFKQLAPVAMAAVDSLIDELTTPGDNGGPPLDDRQEAIDALRSLHDALGALLGEVDTPAFQWVGNPLVEACAGFVVTASDKLKNDPMPFAVSGLLLALFTAFGMPGLGGWLGAATLEMQRRSK